MARNKTTTGTAKRKNTKKHEDDSEHMNESDFEENTLPDDIRINIGQFGKDMMKLAVDQLRDEFMQMAIEGGRQGAQLAIHGEGMAELQQVLEDKERKILQLKMEKKKLESQKEQNEELQSLVAEKERQINILEKEVKNLNKLINKQKKELEKEQASRKTKEDEMVLNIKELEGKNDKLKAHLQMKISAGNVTKVEMQKLRVKMEELEGKPKDRKDKKS